MIEIFFAEYDATHDKTFVFDIPEGHDCWLLLLTQTPVAFWVENELKKYPANCAMLYPPHYKIYYKACDEIYANDWLRFSTDEVYVTENNLPKAVPFQVPDPAYCHKIFQMLTVEHIFDNPYKEATVDCLLRALFNKLLEASLQVSTSPQHNHLLKLRTEIYKNPARHWSIAYMANLLHVSCGHLQTLYKTAFGISCMDDVINSRLRLAKEYLTYSPFSVADIAIQCGYNNVEHFCRQFRKKVGCSPHKFRMNAVSLRNFDSKLDEYDFPSTV